MTRYDLDDFAFDLRRGVQPAHGWVGSGWTTVAPATGTVCGVDGVFAPPYAAPDLALRLGFAVDGRLVSDGARPGIAGHGLLYSGGEWRPDRVARHGTYHHYRDGRLVSFRVESMLTPLYGQGGYALRIDIHNRADSAVRIALRPEFEPGGPVRVPLAEWGWVPPAAGESASVRLDADRADADIAAGARASYTLLVRIGAGGPARFDLAERTTSRWNSRLAAALSRVPQLRADVPGLREYWLRCLTSGLICLWDNPDFVTTPFVATSGIDGGALCAYAWDTGGYAPHLLTLMLGETAAELLEAMLKADLADHYAIAPDGSGLGVGYAYTGWSLVNLATAIACHGGISAGLVTRLHDTVGCLDSALPAVGELRDYGTQHNLLEMRGAGWEHLVASPNAERARCFELLADLADVSGARLPAADMRTRAGRIRAAVIEELWDPAVGWFRSRYPDGHIEVARSIQAYDALRAGAVTDEMAAALLAELRPGAFLGKYGVSSVSAEDEEHYELGDTDWSGGGAYTGEAPLLALTLWERGESALAWDVLRRLLWMGEHFPYFPQEHFCDRPSGPGPHRRANIISGLAGAEAILTGLAGIRPRPDGTLEFRPHPVDGTVELTGLQFRGRTIDVIVSPDLCEITVDGQPVGGPGTVLPVDQSAL
jgi:hypothetical protein